MKLRYLIGFGLFTAALVSLFHKQKSYMDYLNADYDPNETHVDNNPDTQPVVRKATSLSQEDLKSEVIVKTLVAQNIERQNHYVVLHKEGMECYLCTSNENFNFGGVSARHSKQRFEDQVLHVFDNNEEETQE